MSLTLPASRDGLKKAKKNQLEPGFKISYGGGFIVGKNRLQKVPVRLRWDWWFRF
jgi:hypothetical protein